LPLLTEALRATDQPARHVARREYFYAEALHALARTDDAIGAYQRARAAAPSSRYGGLADQRLSAPLSPYR
jgi:hypothetical protein